MVSPKALALLALAAASAHILPAVAADYDPPIYTEPAQEYVPVEVGNGWYLRGDVGYVARADFGDVTYRTFDPVGSTYTDGNRFATQDFNNDVTFGGGVGYRFTDYLRADATVDGFKSRFKGTTNSSFPCSSDVSFIGTGCRSEDSATISTISVMANGYVDLGTYVGFTPYVGAGAGYSYVNWGSYGDQVYCTGAACPGSTFLPVSYNSGHDWRFTYALMAGVAYDINKNLKVDLGYKYRDIDGGDAFGWDSFSSAYGASGRQGHDSGFTQHEVKVGLRYELW